jgi:SAM-dependent methyltransferase
MHVVQLAPRPDGDVPQREGSAPGPVPAAVEAASGLLQSQVAREGVHLDIGCGSGMVAELIAAIPGATYVGIDTTDAALGPLRERGFECHRHAFGDPGRDRAFISGMLRGRRLRSISLIDTLGHIENPEPLLRSLHAIARAEGLCLVVSVPNVAHRDIGLKLAFGRWDYTVGGILDAARYRLFTHEILTDLARATGWRETSARDVRLAESDQHFPADHLVLAEGSALHALLARLRAPEGHDQTVWLVRAFLPDEPAEADLIRPQAAVPRPFLSVITRTQGKRLDTLREVFLSLAAQSCDDYEHLVIGHKVAPERQAELQRIIDDVPGPARDRIRLLLLNEGNRTAPLNLGFREATGRYISVLDDDDVVFGHWVETFRKLADAHPGRIVRAVAVRQDYDEVHTSWSARAPRAVSGMHRTYPAEFDIFQHLETNLTPTLAVAFPRSVFHDFGLRFDETLTTTEDWDFLMRAAFICGVESTAEVTGIYRWWRNGTSSRTEHDQAEWQRNGQRIREKLDEEYIVLPPGSATRARELVRRSTGRMPQTAVHAELVRLLKSRRWRATWPVRLLGQAMGNPPPVTLRQVARMTEAEASSTLESASDSRGMQLVRTLEEIAVSFTGSRDALAQKRPIRDRVEEARQAVRRLRKVIGSGPS